MCLRDITVSWSGWIRLPKGRRSLSGTAEVWDFMLVCTLSQMLGEVTKLLGPRQWTSVLTAQHAAELCVHSCPPCPPGPSEMLKSSPGGCCRFTPLPRNPDLRKHWPSNGVASKSVQSLSRREALPYYAAQKTNLSSPRGRGYVTNILRKITQHRSCQCPSSEDEQKHKRPMENVLPTVLIWFSKAGFDLVKQLEGNRYSTRKKNFMHTLLFHDRRLWASVSLPVKLE